MHFGLSCKPQVADMLFAKKTLLVMKLSVVFLFLLCLQASATGKAQKISLSRKDISLKQVFTEIEKQSGYHFFYKEKLLNSEVKTSLDIKEVSLDEALKVSLDKLPLTYSIVNKTIVISEKDVTKESGPIEIPKETVFSEVQGTVKDHEGKGMQGVSVLVKGSSTGGTTNAEGHYSVQVKDTKGTLVFSFTGYETQEVPIRGRTIINVVLEQKIQSLSDIVVIGYGTQTKRAVTGSISSVDMESLEKDRSNTFTQQLEGKVSGVSVQRSTGMVGAMTRISIRGVSSINASSQPLYVIDGIPMEENSIAGTGEDISPFININTDDIKSIDVLKGASAAAVYGTRGANGVVLITTKSGSANTQKINVKIEGGISKVAKKLKLTETPDYLKIFNYVRHTNYVASDFANTDWQDAVSQTGSSQNYSFDISGGNQKSTYYISANYQEEKGIINENNLRKFGARVKITNKLNNRLEVNLNLAPSVTMLRSMSNHTTINSAFGMAVLEPPTVPIFLPDGSVNNGKNPTVPANLIFNPFAGTPYANVKYSFIDNDSKQILANFGGTYKILSKLTFASNFNYQTSGTVGNADFKNVTSSGYPNGSIGASNRSFTNLSWNNTLNYKNTWNKHSLDLTLVAALENSTRNWINISKSNVTDESMTDLDAASLLVSGGGSTSSFRYQNNVIRANYEYERKYLLTVSGSYDGTSRFARGKRYGFFPAVAAGWVISDEEFMQKVKVLNFLKLRVGYGVTGNANIDNFPYQSLLTSGIKYNNEPAIDFTQLSNLDLTWETSHEFDIGFDFNLFQNRLSGTIDYYNRMTTNLLLQRRVSDINGFTTIFKNGGKMANSGIEFNFKATLIKTRTIRWNLNGNISTLHNEVIDLPGGDIIGTYNLIRVGYPIASLYMPVYKGVNPQNGNALFDDGKNGIAANYSAAPRQIVGSPLPKVFGGFGTDLSYKGLDFSINFSYSQGNKLYWVRAEYMKGSTSSYNQLQSVIDFWRPDNKNAPNPEPRPTANGGNRSSRFIYDASFLRLNYVQLGYTFPKSLFGEKRARIYFGGFNLFTINNFEGFDPGGDNSPRSNIDRGIIQGNDPLNINYNAGIQVSF